jgi:hypothetical protein
VRWGQGLGGEFYVKCLRRYLEQKYTVTSSVMYVNEKGLVTAKEEKIVFEKVDLKHESRKVEIGEEKAKESVVLLTNNMDFPIEDLREIYPRRWAIEMLYRQLKQNFQLHFFYAPTEPSQQNRDHLQKFVFAGTVRIKTTWNQG